MYYFYKEETGEIVKKEHQYNSEVLDGDIIPIDENDQTYLLVHIPNTSFGWDVSVISSYGAKEGYEKWTEIGANKDVERGKPFYVLIKKDLLEEYIKSNEKYDLTNKHIREEKPKTRQRKAKENKMPKEVKKREKNKKERQYKIKLLRDSEKPIKS